MDKSMKDHYSEDNQLINDLQNQIASLNYENDQLSNENQDQKNIIDILENDLESLKYENQQLSDDVENSNRIIDNLNSEIYNLEEEVHKKNTLEEHFEINSIIDEMKLSVLVELFKNNTLEEIEKLINLLTKVYKTC